MLITFIAISAYIITIAIEIINIYQILIIHHKLAYMFSTCIQLIQSSSPHCEDMYCYYPYFTEEETRRRNNLFKIMQLVVELKPELRMFFGSTAPDAKKSLQLCAYHINKYYIVEIHQPMISPYPENTINSHWDPERERQIKL